MKKDERVVAERIAGEVRRLRTECGWSQLNLAERAGLSLNYVSLIERAERLPSIEVLIQLARVLGTTLGNLVGNEPTAEQTDRWLTEATAILRTLPASARGVVLGMLQGAANAAAPGPSPSRSSRRRK